MENGTESLVMTKHVTAVIPTYNGLSLLQKNLPGVLRCLQDSDELIIVDDASSDLTLPWLDAQFKTKQRTQKLNGRKIKTRIGSFQLGKKKIRVVIVQNQKNLRFARSCNKGVLLAKHTLIFLINNDVSPHPDCLSYLMPHFQDKSVFAVAPLEVEKADGNLKAGKNVLEFKRGVFMHRRADSFESGPTAWVSGGSGLFDRVKWLELDGFDPRFAPAYWEDIDLSFRARQHGWQVLFESQAVVDHNHESTNADVFGQQRIAQMSWKNLNAFTDKHASASQKLQHWLWKPYWWWKMR